MRLFRRSSLLRRRRTDPIFCSGLGERRDRLGYLPTSFFAEASEFLFVEALVVFFEDLLGPGQILLLDEYVAPAAKRNSRTSSAAHTRNARVRKASKKKTLLDRVAGRGENLEHLRKGSVQGPVGRLKARLPRSGTRPPTPGEGGSTRLAAYQTFVSSGARESSAEVGAAAYRITARAARWLSMLPSKGNMRLRCT